MSFSVWFKQWRHSVYQFLAYGSKSSRKDVHNRKSRRKKPTRSFYNGLLGKKKRARRRSSHAVRTERMTQAVLGLLASTFCIVFVPFGLLRWGAQSSKSKKNPTEKLAHTEPKNRKNPSRQLLQTTKKRAMRRVVMLRQTRQANQQIQRQKRQGRTINQTHPLCPIKSSFPRVRTLRITKNQISVTRIPPSQPRNARRISTYEKE